MTSRDVPAAATRAAGVPRVVIVGGGFGGLAAARALADAPALVTLVDRRNHHVFQPLLYQVATAGLAAPDIAAPIRQVVHRQHNTHVLMADVLGVDLARRVVLLAAGPDLPGDPDRGVSDDALLPADTAPRARVVELPYDHLILAPGAVPDFFGHDAWARHAPGLKDCADAISIRRRILLAFEAAEREDDPLRRARWLTFAVIGGGPTGVELAGALADIARRTLVRNFRRFEAADARIVLVEAGPRLLPAFAERLSDEARAKLVALGVEVRLQCRVIAVDAGSLTLQPPGGVAPEQLPCGAMIWAAGVKPAPLLADMGIDLDRAGRAIVRDDLTLPGHAEVAVIGDAAAVRDATREDREAARETRRRGGGPGAARDSAAPGPRTVPGLAPAAMQMGRHAAANILRALHGEAPLPFRYRDKGNLATIGRSSAVAQFGQRSVAGKLAWILWATVHIAYLIGFRNRIAVLFEWAWLWMTQQRSARVIMELRDDTDRPREERADGGSDPPAPAATLRP